MTLEELREQRRLVKDCGIYMGRDSALKALDLAESAIMLEELGADLFSLFRTQTGLDEERQMHWAVALSGDRFETAQAAIRAAHEEWKK